MGCKAWLFSNSQKGACVSANLYSLVETAKACGLEPYAYLKDLLTLLPAAETVDNIEQPPPWNRNLHNQLWGLITAYSEHLD